LQRVKEPAAREWYILVIHTEREATEETMIIRIISCRKATASERRTYEEGED
jgi:uncharacterized DUF497 family protein